MEVPGLFNISSHVTFRNTYYPNGVLRQLLRIDELDANGRIVASRIESSNNNKPVGMLFIQHPLEREILQRLEDTTHTIPGRDLKAIKKNDVFTSSEPKGYLPEEVDQLIKVLTARGLIEEENYQGVTYLYLQKTEISMAELSQGVEELEALDAKARDLGFVPEWRSAHGPGALRQRLDDPDTQRDEIAKDHLRRDLREAKQDFQGTVTTWLTKAFENLVNLEKSTGILAMDVPKILEQATGNPATDFSIVLFVDIRRPVLGQYQRHNEQVGRLQSKIRECIVAEKTSYEQERSVPNALATAGRIGQHLTRFKAGAETLGQSQSSLSAHHIAYQKWRDLARQIEEYRLMLVDLADDDGIQALLTRLDAEQNSIKMHLADRGQTLIQVLDAHEHYRNRIREIVSEFDQVAKNREQKFLAYQGEIHDQLKQVSSTAPQSIVYNRSNDDGVYREVNQRAADSLQAICETAIDAFNKVQTSLLKPLEVFHVEPQIRTEAQSLTDDIRLAKQNILKLRGEITPDYVSSSIANWVGQLRQAREGSAALLDRHERIMAQLRTSREQLSGPARTLLREIEKGKHKDLTELIISLRGSNNSNFSSAAQIVNLLEELYQRNWINIHIELTSGQ